MCIPQRILIFLVLISVHAVSAGIGTSGESQETNREKHRQPAAAGTKNDDNGGRVLSKGEGDDPLRQDSNLVPPRGTAESAPCLRKSGRALHGFRSGKGQRSTC